MPVTVRKRRTGEGGKPWKIVESDGTVVGESDTRDKALISMSYRNKAYKKKTGK